MPHAPSKPHCTKLKLFKAIQIPVREQYKVFLLLFFYIKRIYFAFFNLKKQKTCSHYICVLDLYACYHSFSLCLHFIKESF